MNIQDDLPDESDTSDEDYDPGMKEDEVSEVDSDGDPEEPLSDNEQTKKSKSKKRKKGKLKARKTSKIKLNENVASKENKIQPTAKEEDTKKKEDDLWADFMKDTGFVSKTISKSIVKSVTGKPVTKTSGTKEDCESLVKPTLEKQSEKVKIKQIFQFAGEEIEVEKEVSKNSTEARLLSNSSNDLPRNNKVKRAAGLSGIGNVLSQLSKKPKISTLEKTKLDWDRFKKEENIEEELSTHNKGKDGYLDRQEFLDRADLRRFEIEKELRSVERNKRFNSTL